MDAERIGRSTPSRRLKKERPLERGQVVGEYFYDDQGFRVRKVSRRTVAGEDRQIEVLYPSMYFGIEKQYTAGGTEIEESHCAVNNVYLNGVRVAVVAPSGQALYYLTDQVDSVKVVVNDSGLPIKRFEYLPYGETWFEEGEGSHAPKYNSQELDLETGYYFYNARHYDPEINRFVTADNVIDGEYDTQGWNRYSYVKGNPIAYKDPTGHEADYFASTGGEMPSFGQMWNFLTGKGGGQGGGKSDSSGVKEKLQNVKIREVNNKAKQYINQYDKVAPNGDSACNVSLVAMFTGEDPNKIRAEIRKKYGDSQNEDYLIKYLKDDKKYNVKAITKYSKDGNAPTEDDFSKMREEIDSGKKVFYHMKGHYTMLKGYREKDVDGEKSYEYIFNDPGGDRKIKGYYSRNLPLESGKDTTYSQSMLEKIGIKGRTWSVEEK
ncbi:MAG: hypothetical protein CVV44_21415 [Spirochaetae bacterium HGW-Spirochaetae-1]|jgi:RHS repeat-associated protein|nr:MAG: hypothetical protein CVV44_21415 [Spirochaetae bacterium HGW-Spirochaetae-1]